MEFTLETTYDRKTLKTLFKGLRTVLRPEKMRKGRWLFREDGYFSDTEAGESDYSYKNIFLMVESQGYMMLVFHEGTAHVIDLSTIQGGTAADFRKLLRRQTNLTIQEA